MVPPGGTWIGPFPKAPFLIRFWWFPLALLGTAAFLIFLNGVALLSPVFFTAWVAFLPWVASLGAFGFILGVVLGLVMLGALVMLFLGFRVLAALIVFPAAIVSLFIGGGFIAGVVIGVVAGLLILLRERFP
jgi:hypothetical protein